MGNVEAPINITAGSTVLAKINNPTQMQAIRVSNKSSYDLSANGFGINGQEWLAAGVEYMLYASRGNQGYISFTAFNNANLSPPPAGVVLITEYFVDEKLPHGQWPVSIPAQIVQGNLSVTTLKNDGSVAGTSIVEATVSGDVSSAVNLTNDGTLTLGDAAHSGSLSVAKVKLFDNTNTAQDFAYILGATNDNTIVSNSNHDILHLANNAAADVMTLNGTNFLVNVLGILDISTSSGGYSTGTNGSVSGTINIYQPLTGAIKVVLLKWNNYQDAGTHNFSIPSPFSFGCIMLNGGIGNSVVGGGYTARIGGADQTCQMITGLASTGGTKTDVTIIYEYSIVQCNSAIDTVHIVNNTGARTGLAILIGI